MDNYQNVVVDLSHHNTVLASGFHEMQGAGIKAVVHKATQGLSMVDPEYAGRRDRALSIGLLWGGYHFGTDQEGVAQASVFLDAVGPHDGQLLVLDWEPNSGSVGNTMSREQASAFVGEVFRQTGRYPVLYSGNSFLLAQALSIPAGDPLTKCKLWIARYAATPPIPPKQLAEDWAMWQYTDGQVGPIPRVVPGVGNCDRDKFNPAFGTLEEFWKG